VEYEITPEPNEEERAAILAALGERDEVQSAWAEAALQADEEPESP
jgi:hypothetical protein